MRFFLALVPLALALAAWGSPIAAPAEATSESLPEAEPSTSARTRRLTRTTNGELLIVAGQFWGAAAHIEISGAFVPGRGSGAELGIDGTDVLVPL